MREWLTPRKLFVAGLTLLAVAVAGTLVVHHPRTRPGGTAAPVPTSPVPTIPTVPAFSISTAATPAPGPFAATVVWETPTPSTGRLTWGPAGMTPLLWSTSSQPSTVHRDVLTGLASSSHYVVSIEASSPSGMASARLDLTTAATPSEAVGTVRDGSVQVVDAPFFPLITWQECPSQWSPDIADGINLFAGNPCTGLNSLLTAVQGKALAVGTTDDTPDTTGPGLLGWFYPDEADGRGLTGSNLTAPGGGLRFLTLTSHFYPLAAPLPTGRGMYPGLLAKSDVVGFDLYPLQEFCRPDLLPWVFDAQQQLTQLAKPRPTFQWIEVRQMKCSDAASAVTPRTIRLESWLAIAGGAHGLGFFPGDWGTNVGTAVHGITARIRQLEPALLRPAVAVGISPAETAVRASARSFGGALYVIAANAGTRTVVVTLDVPGLKGRRVLRIGTQRSLDSRGTHFDATIPPLSVRIYVARPSA